MSVDSGLTVNGGGPAGPRAGPVVAPTPPTGHEADEPGRRAARSAARDATPAAAGRRGRGRPRRKGRRVKRIVRRVELWSVLKVAIVFYTCMFGIVLGSVAALWALAVSAGLVDDIEGFLRQSGFEDYQFDGERMFRQVAFIGAVVTLVVTVFTVLAAALVNVISELTGGIRFVVIEELTEVDEEIDESGESGDGLATAPPPGRRTIGPRRVPAATAISPVDAGDGRSTAGARPPAEAVPARDGPPSASPERRGTRDDPSRRNPAPPPAGGHRRPMSEPGPGPGPGDPVVAVRRGSPPPRERGRPRPG